VGRRQKGTAQRILDRQIERSLLKAMPELPRLFQSLAVQVENFDGSEPRTFLDRMEADLRPVGEKLRIREPRFRRLFASIFRKFTAKILIKAFVSQMITIAKESAISDNRYSLLLKLMHDSDQKVPFISLVAANAYAAGKAFCYYADHKAFFVAQSTAISYYKQAECASGEARAVLALEALAKTVELVYKPYLATLWFLSYVKVGKPLPKHVPDLGCMLGVILDRLPEYRGLVELDSVWMRNSAVHNEPDYVLGEDSLWMWDRSHCRKKVRVEDMMSMTAKMYVISTQTVQWVSCLYVFREVLQGTGLLDMVAECVAFEVAGKANELTEAESRMRAYAELLFEPLERFLQQ